MMFVAQITAMPGRYEETVRLLKHLRMPKEIKVKFFLGLFGKPDAIIIFETLSETSAAEFVGQFANVAECSTALSVPIEDLKWTS
jgi:hypothetical protein